MQQRGFTWIELVVLVAFTLVLAAIILPVFSRGNQSRDNKRRSSCQSQLKQIGIGFRQYTADYNEKFPLVASHNISSSLFPFKTPFGWADAIYPYNKTTSIYQCPSESNSPNINNSAQIHFTDYWFNAKLAGVEEAATTFISNTFLLGDGNTGRDATNARYSLSQIPAAWIGDPESPTSRHLGGMNFAFADGHVKWLKAPTTPLSAPVTVTRFSFQYK